MVEEPADEYPLSEAIGIIKALLELCEANGLKQEAYAIAAGVEGPNLANHPPGAPPKWTPLVKWNIALILAYNREATAKANKNVSFARALAEELLKEENKGKRVGKRQLEKRTRTIENVISQISPQAELLATFLVRRLLKGEAPKVTKEAFERLLAGDQEAQSTFSEEMVDKRDLFQKFMRLNKRQEPHEY